MSTWLMLVMLTGLLGLGCMALNYDGRATAGISDPEALRQVILEAAPVGSPLEQAEQFLETDGSRRSETVNKAGEASYAGSHSTPLSLSWTFRWVTLTHRDGRLEDVRVRIAKDD